MCAQVVEGFEVVKAIESCGSRSGETAFDVMIADCGELPKGELHDATRQAAPWQTREGHVHGLGAHSQPATAQASGQMV